MLQALENENGVQNAALQHCSHTAGVGHAQQLLLLSAFITTYT